MGKKTAEQLFAKLGIELEYGCGRFKGRHIRWLPHLSLFEVGEDDATFDRWANSCDFYFDLDRPPERRAFMRWARSIEDNPLFKYKAG